MIDVETIESLANIRAGVHVCANRYACVHACECVFIDMRAHACVRIRANLCVCTRACIELLHDIIISILSPCAYVSTCFRLYVSIGMNMSHICDNALL